MRSWLLLFGVCLVAAAAVLPAGGPGRAAAVEERDIEFEVIAPNGLRVQLLFSVRAEDSEGAYEAAMLATTALMPGAEFPAEDEVTAQYTFWPWAWPDEMLPVPVAFNSADAVAGLTEGALTGAMATWNAVVTSRLRMEYQGGTEAVPGLQEGNTDGVNTVGSLNLPCSSYRNCALAVTAKVERAYEADIVLNSNPEARRLDAVTGKEPDVQTTLVHELGHLAGLGHSCTPGPRPCTEEEAVSVMYPTYLGMARDLRPDDIAAITALYPGSGAPQGQAGTFPPGAPSTLAYPVVLQPGWNLVILPPGEFAGTMTLLPCASAIYAYREGAWLTWIREGAAALNSVTAADGESPYWVYATGSCSQTFTAARFS